MYKKCYNMHIKSNRKKKSEYESHGGMYKQKDKIEDRGQWQSDVKIAYK